MSNVKLAIRVRPFTERELKSEKERTPVVNVVDENIVTITNVKVSTSGAGDSRERVRRYFADYTFDSACAVTLPAYASQEKVFDTIGREVVARVSHGSSACVLTYGQSATGKTHTMMGSDAQPGLVPRVCRALAEQQLFSITISFLEIYNERVHDLLAGEAPLTCHSLPRRRGNTLKDLRVREHPSRGPYVQNLRRVAVHDVNALLSLVAEGARRRQTAATRRNSTSSRSHALLELSTPCATLHLADLAGSEKASWEGCGGGRQKEGANINKSLVALSNVISALVGGGYRGRFVPYRDSALTWLLKDCFTGGATTFIIATVSPSVACYGESASTLRWAERARQLPKPKILTCGRSAVSRAALQAQLNQLFVELAKHHILYTPETGKISYDEYHWTLQENKTDSRFSNVTNKDSNIGNIMNMFNSKTDAHNSESTASSIAGGSSEIITTIDNNINIKDEISKEVDKLFGPALERTRSGSDLEVTAPLRNRRRQYKSQEVLPIYKALHGYNMNMLKTSSSQSQEQINESADTEKSKVPHIPILYDNQRAEIVSSVTERLYSKLKKKEEAAASKMESIVDRKIIEPLNELRICTNARQRLMELSQKAMRNKRRIGIPAHTQTKISVTRVRDQGIDVQSDLETYVIRKERSCTLQHDASTEIVPLTPRCKEVAVGPKFGSLDFHDRSTITETKQIVLKNSYMMTDVVVTSDRCTQTPILPPPRRKKRSLPFSKYIQSAVNKRENTADCTAAPVISINISQQYPVESESQSSDNDQGNKTSKTKANVTMTPDLLTNHNTVDISAHGDNTLVKISEAANNVNLLQENPTQETNLKINRQDSEDFTDSEDYSLPRVTVDTSRSVKQEEMKDMILGRNENQYPYNIVLSPLRDKENSKRIVTFKDTNASNATSMASQTSTEWENITYSNIDSNKINSEKEKSYSNLSNYSDSTDSSKVETNSFVWKKVGSQTLGGIKRSYTPVYRSNSRYTMARAKIYKEFLGLDDGHNEEKVKSHPALINAKDVMSSDHSENEQSQHEFRQRRQFFEDKFNRDYNRRNERYQSMERSLIGSCNSLDTSVNKYKRYLTSFYGNKNKRPHDQSEDPLRRPTEYLQHLVQLRREVVKADYDTTDESSVGMYRK